jgi:hypothetical protein
LTRTILGVVVCFAAISGPVAAQLGVTHAPTVIEWANPVSGLWTDADNWSPKIVPNSPDHVAVLGLSGSYMVIYVKSTIGSLRIENPAAELAVSSTILSLNPAPGMVMLNHGTIHLAGQPNVQLPGINFMSDTTIEGTGRMVLGSKWTPIFVIQPGVTVVNGPFHTIEAAPQVFFADAQATLTNRGTISPGGAGGPGYTIRAVSLAKPGTLRLEPPSHLLLELAGSSYNDKVVGAAGTTVELGGLLDVRRTPYSPLFPGDHYVLISGAALQGEFDEIHLPALPVGRGWRLSSLPTSLAIEVVCKADCDVNWMFTIDDFVCFQSLYAVGDPLADCDGDGTLTIGDFVCFQSAFAAGC